MRSNAAEQVIGGKLTGLVANGTWVPMATAPFASMTGALLAGWLAVRAKG